MRVPDLQTIGSATRVGIGKTIVGGPEASLRATLGSCVGVCIAVPQRMKFGLAHVLLPHPKTGVEPVGADASRYASTVVRYLLEELEVEPQERRKLRAYVAGGASMFDDAQKHSQVGSDNQEALLQALKEDKIQVVAEDFGGPSGRQLVVHGPSASVVSLHLDDASQSEFWELPAVFRAFVRQQRNN